MNSRCYEFNRISHKEFSFNLIHTNLASIAKHQLTLSLLKTKFDIIGITENKIRKVNDSPVSNIDIPGYQPDCSDTSHGSTGFY